MDRRARILERMDQPGVVNTSGALALLLQFAHPLAAAGVASTGKFQSCPRSRLQHTSKAIHQLMACEAGRIDKEKLARHLAGRHAQIKGELSETVGGWQAGTPYSASDPQLLLWVYATLVVSRVQVFSALYYPLSEGEQELFYRSTRAFGEFFGITEEIRPSTYKDLVHYFECTLETLAVGREGKQLIDAFLTSFGTGATVIQAVMADLLPEKICDGYGFPRTRRKKHEAVLYRLLIARLYTPLQPLLRRMWYSLDLHMRTQQAA